MKSSWRKLADGGGGIVPAVAYALFVYALMPAGVAVFNDDFGYLRSVVETWQRGRPWTDDWLEPWAASLSLISAGVWRLTGSFALATQGVQAVCAGVGYGMVVLLLRARGWGGWWVVGGSVVVMTFPTLLWKTAEFGGMALYVPCLLGAILAVERGGWGWFALAWWVALASRQSAVVWGVWPACAVVAGLWVRRSKGKSVEGWWHPLAVLGAGAALWWGLSAGMNRTHAQAMITEHVFENVRWVQSLRGLGVAAVVGFCAAGWGGLVTRGWGVGRGGERTSGVNATGRIGGSLVGMSGVFSVRAMIALLIAVGLAWFDLRRWLEWEHHLLAGATGAIYLGGVLLGGAVGWALGGWRIGRPAVWVALACAGLVALRGVVWDYYLVDVALVMFFGVKSESSGVVDVRPEPAVRAGWGGGSFARGMLAIVLVIHAGWIIDVKAQLDRAWLVCCASERAMRAGRLHPEELSFAPFGFGGWKLYPYYLGRPEGVRSADIAGFGCYFRPGAIEVGQGFTKVLHVVPRFRHEPPADRSNLVESVAGRYLFFFRAEYFLLRFKSAEQAPPAIAIDPAAYSRRPFPLDDAEWLALAGDESGRSLR